jgi:hypothetical protein
LASLVCCTNQASAQLGNLLKKAKKEAGGGSGGNSGSKKEVKIYGVIMNGKKFNYTVGQSDIFSIQDDGYAYTDKETNTEKMTTQLSVQNERRSWSEIFRKEVLPDDFYFDDNGNNTYMKKIDAQTFLVFKMDNNKKIEEQTMEDVLFSVWLSSDKAVIDDIVANKNNSAGYKSAQENINKCFSLVKNKEAGDEVKEVAEWEKIFANAKLPEVSAFQPADAKKKAPAAVKAAMEKFCKGQELVYYYFGIRPGVVLENNWRIVKEARRNDQGLDRIVTKRSLTIVAVVKTDAGKHMYHYFPLTEDVLPGVFDGSKFTGDYYIESIGANNGIAKANAMVNKGK